MSDSDVHKEAPRAYIISCLSSSRALGIPVGLLFYITVRGTPLFSPHVNHSPKLTTHSYVYTRHQVWCDLGIHRERRGAGVETQKNVRGEIPTWCDLGIHRTRLSFTSSSFSSISSLSPSYDSLICVDMTIFVMCPIYLLDTTLSFMLLILLYHIILPIYDSLICADMTILVMWLINLLHHSPSLWCDSLNYYITLPNLRLTNMCRHDHICDMTQYVWRGSVVCWIWILK